jgi:predicted ATPase
MAQRKDAATGEAESLHGDQRPASPPLVDRSLELDVLREHVRRVARGRAGHAVVLVGESGVGKSRLAAEVVAEAARLDMQTVAAQCLGRGAEPLLPLTEALAQHLGRSRKRVQMVLVGAAPQLLDAVPFVGAFLAALGSMAVEGHQLSGGGAQGVYEGLPRAQ